LVADTTRVIPNIDLALSQYMLPMPASSKITAMGNGMPVAYGVAPVVCFAQAPTGVAEGIPCGGVREQRDHRDLSSASPGCPARTPAARSCRPSASIPGSPTT
jgi:hypothetical protein